MTTTAQILTAARALITDPRSHTKYTFARDANNQATSAVGHDACKWCASGAIDRAAFNLKAGEPCAAQEALRTQIPRGVQHVPDYNDHVASHSEILALFDKAIAKETTA